jgi:transcriptional regulator with XRE-family HTH domain
MTSTRTPRYRQFLTRLRQARVEAGFTQAQAAAALGKPQPYLSKCESGERRVDVVELEKFAKVYGKPLSYFLP